MPQYGFDAARANRLLDEAGFRRGAGNMRFKASIELTPSSEFSRVSEYMKQALSRVGIDIEIRTSDLGTLLRRLYTDYDFNVSQNFLYMLPDPSAGVQRLYYGPNIRPGVVFSNASGWSTPALDKLWEEALVVDRGDLDEFLRLRPAAAPLLAKGYRVLRAQMSASFRINSRFNGGTSCRAVRPRPRGTSASQPPRSKP